MKLKKLLAGVSAAAMAASVMAVSASAADASTAATKPTEPTVPKSVTLDPNGPESSTLEDALKTAPKAIQIPLKDIQPTDATASITNVTMRLSATNAPAAGWIGGGGAIGFNCGSEDWAQKDTANVFGEDGREVIGNDGQYDIYDRDLTVADCTWTESWDFEVEATSEDDYDLPDSDDANVTEYAKIIQFGWWWGAGDTVDILEWTVTYSDGEVFTLVSTEAWESYQRESDAYNALVKLNETIDNFEVDIDAIVDSTNAAAIALSDAKNALATIDDAIKSVADLQAAVDEAQAVFDKLKADETTNTEAFEAAKKKVSDAKADLEAAKKNLDDAIKAYDAATAEQLAEKDKQIADLEAEKEALQAELDKLKADAEANAAQIEELNAQLAAKDEEIAKLNTEKADLQTKLDEAIKNGGSVSDNNASAGDKDEVPNTGVAVAFAGLALAAAGAVVSKKRK